ncbi:MAG: glutamine--fructose-6-phosphate transaminase (isomerizing) [Syntrophomonadaceae bacterium]|nr:glutamine--fructose-6-phosphate transaminase (isomerizing) [Syntrophomonadaceae bacterium]
MCGIIGYIGYNDAIPVIIDGLNKLEYRGYDSAGLAIINEGVLEVHKKKGRLADLATSLEEYPLSNIGIGHTRWATHGVPSHNNSHPHMDCSGRIAIVHNGIIENYTSLRNELINKGHDFVSETDTEVIVHLIEEFYTESLELAVRESLSYLSGSFAFAVICQNEPDKIIAVKKDSPLIVGIGDKENYIASDIPALLGKTKKVFIIEDNEMAVVTDNNVAITTWDGKPVNKELMEVKWDTVLAEKAGFDHFMIKEIYEQPEALRNTLRGKVKDGLVDLSFLQMDADFNQVDKIYIVACGTAYHAGLVGKKLIEKIARVPVETDVASEFRYKDILWQPNNLVIVISQSGETADTLAALRAAKQKGVKVLAITNVVGSSVAREADDVLYTHAGPEIAVASTKAYSSQLLILYLLAIYIAQVRGVRSHEDIKELTDELIKIDKKVELVLKAGDKIKQIAHKYQHVESTFFIGRGLDCDVAMEGALKLKEISYIHAEAYPAGELKHGPLALISEGVPVLALITQDHLVEKSMSNIKEVMARGAVVIAICKENLEECEECNEQILLPDINPLLAPLISIVPLQMFAYYMAVFKGTDVDKPRNLAKSVTVE